MSLLPRVETAVARAARSLIDRQQEGAWPADYGGPLFLLPGFVFAHQLIGRPFVGEHRDGSVTYLRSTQLPDGGWGLHTEGAATVLGTALSYVALRLLGVPADGAAMRRARDRLHTLGGAEQLPSWGKFWLALLGIYEWHGVAPTPPELWLLPRWFPLHPGRMWCHTRAVLLPMCHLWGHRPEPLQEALISSLRREIFVTPAEQIRWPALRDQIAATDRFAPPSIWARAARILTQLYELRPSARLRERALAETYARIRYEDETTSFLAIGPVSKALHLVAVYVEEGDSPALRRHLERVRDYLFHGADGIKVRGYHGTQLWDTAFAAQALHAARTRPTVAGVAVAGVAVDRAEVDAALERAHTFLAAQQVQDELPERIRFSRGAVRHGWPFSTAEQGWIVSDCTAEALKVALALGPQVQSPIPLERLQGAVERLLDAQNRDGGWSEYEPTRGGWLLRKLDAAEMFGDVMVARSHVECTSACLQALAAFSRNHPASRTPALARSLRRGERFLRRQQRPDGSFYGAWGVCFTYGTWFGVEGLIAAGASPRDPALRRARRFLREHQSPDGGWGEAFATCTAARWIPAEQSQVVQTAWAVMTLIAAGGLALPDEEPESRRAIDQGVALLAERQQPDGGWAKERPAGVFNRTCAIDYDNYRSVMPLWALARYARALRPSLAET